MFIDLRVGTYEVEMLTELQDVTQHYIELKSAILEQQELFIKRTRSSVLSWSTILHTAQFALFLFVLANSVSLFQRLFAAQGQELPPEVASFASGAFGQTLILFMSLLICVALLTIPSRFVPRPWVRGRRIAVLLQDFIWNPILLVSLLYTVLDLEGTLPFPMRDAPLVGFIAVMLLLIIVFLMVADILRRIRDLAPDVLFLLTSHDQLLPEGALMGLQSLARKWTEIRVAEVHRMATNRADALGVEVQIVSFFLGLAALFLAAIGFIAEQVGSLDQLLPVHSLTDFVGSNLAIYGPLFLLALIGLMVVTYRYFLRAYKEVKALDTLQTICEIEIIVRGAKGNNESVGQGVQLKVNRIGFGNRSRDMTLAILLSVVALSRLWRRYLAQPVACPLFSRARRTSRLSRNNKAGGS